MIFEIYTPKNPMSTVGSLSLEYFLNFVYFILTILNESKQIIYHIQSAPLYRTIG